MVCVSDKNFVHEFFKKEFEPFKLRFEYNGNPYEVMVIPKGESEKEDIPLNFNLIINATRIAEINCTQNKWESNSIQDQKLIDRIGYYIYKRYDDPNL
ncbi:MAG TPA: hypothetical protein VH396_18710 [Chitinophagaceae bacterium]|jgi:hypothetical protein